MHPMVLGAARACLAPWSEVLRLHILQAIYLHPGQPTQLIHRGRLSFGRHLPRSIEPLRRHGNRLMLPVDPDERAFHEIAELEREDGDAKPILAAAIH